MRSVIFMFKRDVSVERQNTILDGINKWQYVCKASRIKPDSKVIDIFRMCYVYFEDDSNLDINIGKLSEYFEIESVEVPADRMIV